MYSNLNKILFTLNFICSSEPFPHAAIHLNCTYSLAIGVPNSAHQIFIDIELPRSSLHVIPLHFLCYDDMVKSLLIMKALFTRDSEVEDLFSDSHRRRKRWGGGRGGQAPNDFGGGQHTLWPPIIHLHFPSISMCDSKN